MIRQLRTNDAMELLRMLQQGSSILDGNEVSISAAASTAVQQVRHSLGRAYRGAVLVFADQPTSPYALDPATQAEPGTYLYFRLTAATATVARMWVY